MRTFTAVAKPPVYTIIEVEEIKTKADRNSVNNVLDNAGSNSQITFKFSGGVMEYDAGAPYLCTLGRYRSLQSKYLVVAPNGTVVQANKIDGFEII